jgi:hypothetical protein
VSSAVTRTSGSEAADRGRARNNGISERHMRRVWDWRGLTSTAEEGLQRSRRQAKGDAGGAYREETGWGREIDAG